MSVVDWVILVLAVLCVGGAIAAWLWRKKQEKTGCGGGCCGCPHADDCVQEAAQKEKTENGGK